MTAERLPEQSGPAAGLLVVVAVPAEAEAVRRGLGGNAPVEVLAAGVGPAAAAAGTAVALARGRFRLVLSAGIAGGFAPAAPIGSLVVADALVAADLGAETPDGFADVAELGFGTVRHAAPDGVVELVAAATGGAVGEVLTVSTVTGSAARAEQLRSRHPRALAEAMEGFGVAEAAARFGLAAGELRAVSNAVGPRDRAAWRIGEALAALERAFAALPVSRLLQEV
ncbi:futalosine hydrolase [Kitasatospora sp. CB02891]|uniref:futalosine hydrolase n=1 Tax=Kitasatospora sp. CB02891 TaxID=2020329 RepID=UPI000C26F080|nr:futalosine hydrolase [Kitasatospora sp. CB02891]PJN24158.1 futalosine hydrolase [Kitasatospora sp. CB02891]